MEAGATNLEDTGGGAGVRLRASTDELTGINNRRGFFARAQEVFDRVHERDGECTAIVIDLDRLGVVNDAYGHHAGSELIREAAAALVAHSDPDDVVGRIGGDELVLLRPSSIPTAAGLRDEIAEAVARASRADRPYGLAVSVGVAVAPARQAATLDALLSRADQAMYEHKRSGGGQLRGPHVRRERRTG